jgi:hypothetical protein
VPVVGILKESRIISGISASVKVGEEDQTYGLEPRARNAALN